MFATTVDLEDQVDDLVTRLTGRQETLSWLATLYPESLSHGNWGDAD